MGLRIRARRPLPNSRNDGDQLPSCAGRSSKTRNSRQIRSDFHLPWTRNGRHTAGGVRDRRWAFRKIYSFVAEVRYSLSRSLARSHSSLQFSSLSVALKLPLTSFALYDPRTNPSTREKTKTVEPNKNFITTLTNPVESLTIDNPGNSTLLLLPMFSMLSGRLNLIRKPQSAWKKRNKPCSGKWLNREIQGKAIVGGRVLPRPRRYRTISDYLRDSKALHSVARRKYWSLGFGTKTYKPNFNGIPKPRTFH